MKKIIVFFMSIVLMLILMFSCAKNIPSNPSAITSTTPTTTYTETTALTLTITQTLIVASVFDNFQDGDNRTDLAVFGGIWYTYDDLADQISPTANCGNSTIWPISDIVARQTPNCTPTFIMSSYSVAGETPPSGVTSSYFARVYGNVNKSATGNLYGYAGFGANLLDVASDGVKNTINAIATGYTRLQFWFKNGPTVTGTTAWKVTLHNSALIGGIGPCVMEDVDDVPVCTFTSTNIWQKFDKSLISDFANENWGLPVCGTRAPLTTCAGLTGGIAYFSGGSEYRCTAVQALTALNGIRWQTDFMVGSAVNPFDLEIAEVVLVK